MIGLWHSNETPTLLRPGLVRLVEQRAYSVGPMEDHEFNRAVKSCQLPEQCSLARPSRKSVMRAGVTRSCGVRASAAHDIQRSKPQPIQARQEARLTA